MAEHESDLEQDLNRLLAQTLYQERKRSALRQRTITERCGVPQQNISAYERGRVTPCWETFVKLLLAMDRIPVLSTRPIHHATQFRGTAEDRLHVALTVVAEVVGERDYSIWDRAACYLHGQPMTAERVISDEVVVLVAGDPAQLDRLALDVSEHGLAVRTERGAGKVPLVRFEVEGVTIVLVVRADPPPAVAIALDVTSGSRNVQVAPIDRIEPWWY